jgi:hypothetical protein
MKKEVGADVPLLGLVLSTTNFFKMRELLRKEALLIP